MTENSLPWPVVVLLVVALLSIIIIALVFMLNPISLITTQYVQNMTGSNETAKLYDPNNIYIPLVSFTCITVIAVVSVWLYVNSRRGSN